MTLYGMHCSNNRPSLHDVAVPSARARIKQCADATLNLDTGSYITMASTQSKACQGQEDLFNQFHKSTDFQEILSTFQSLCNALDLDCNSNQHNNNFYAVLRKKLTAWRTRALYPLLDARAALPEYDNQQVCQGKRVLIVGAGPVGLRSAIEAALLGAAVDVVEKRTDFSRNNCLHLWPFVVTDLKNLGAKVFYSKFASGGIDHISKSVTD